MPSLQQNIMQAISDFNGVRSAIENNGVSVPSGTDTSEYNNLINQACAAQRTEGVAEGVAEGYSEGYSEGFAEGVASVDVGCDTSLITDWSSFFTADKRLEILEQIDTSGGTIFTSMFANCQSMTSVPVLDTSNGTNFSAMFANCPSLETIGGVDFSSMELTSASMFANTSSLKNITVNGTLKITNNNFRMSYSNDLTVESMMSVINALADNAGMSRLTVYFNSTNLNKLTASQQAIATAKNIGLA